MKRTSLGRLLYLSHLSQPSHERAVYRAIRQLQADTVVEFGVGMGVRSRRMIATSLRYHSAKAVRFVGIDMFEARSADAPGMTLKRTHRMLSQSGAQIQLIPGDALSALARSANALTGTDVIVLGSKLDIEPLWFYLPRMMHEDSQLLIEHCDGKPRFEQLGAGQVAEKAAEMKKSRAA